MNQPIKSKSLDMKAIWLELYIDGLFRQMTHFYWAPDSRCKKGTRLHLLLAGEIIGSKSKF